MAKITEKAQSMIATIRSKEDLFKNVGGNISDMTSAAIDFLANNVDHDTTALVAGILASNFAGRKITTKIAIGTAVAKMTKKMLVEASENQLEVPKAKTAKKK